MEDTLASLPSLVLLGESAAELALATSHRSASTASPKRLRLGLGFFFFLALSAKSPSLRFMKENISFCERVLYTRIWKCLFQWHVSYLWI